MNRSQHTPYTGLAGPRESDWHETQALSLFILLLLEADSLDLGRAIVLSPPTHSLLWAINTGIEAPSSKCPSHDEEKDIAETDHLELRATCNDDLVYDNVYEEPELTARTWIALAAMFSLNLVQIVALQGPPAVVRDVKYHD